MVAVLSRSGLVVVIGRLLAYRFSDRGVGSTSRLFAIGWCRWFTGGYYVTLEVLPLLAIIYALNNVAPKTNAPGSASETSPILGR